MWRQGNLDWSPYNVDDNRRTLAKSSRPVSIYPSSCNSFTNENVDISNLDSTLEEKQSWENFNASLAQLTTAASIDPSPDKSRNMDSSFYAFCGLFGTHLRYLYPCRVEQWWERRAGDLFTQRISCGRMCLSILESSQLEKNMIDITAVEIGRCLILRDGAGGSKVFSCSSCIHWRETKKLIRNALECIKRAKARWNGEDLDILALFLDIEARGIDYALGILARYLIGHGICKSRLLYAVSERSQIRMPPQLLCWIRVKVLMQSGFMNPMRRKLSEISFIIEDIIETKDNSDQKEKQEQE